MSSFDRQVAKYALEYAERFRAVARTAVNDTAHMASVPVGKGGRMRIDTGFLRASIQGAVQSMPSGPTTNEGKRNYPAGSFISGEPVAVALLRWNPNDGTPFFVGWTANYARKREAYDGFMRGAVEKWDQTVAKAAKKVEKGLG